MHENHVGIAAAAGVERLAGTLRDDFHLDPGLLLEQRENVPKQAESCVDVVDDTTIDLSWAETGALDRTAAAATAAMSIRRLNM